MSGIEAGAANIANLPYRPGVGIVVLNGARNVWVGRRCEDLVAQELTHRWQMPQGGIDPDEDPRAAALRELWEETGIRSVELLGESDWIAYDLPPEAVGKALGGRYRGQRQKWFAALFSGDDGEVDLACHGSPEFDAWRWADPGDLLDLVVPFKRAAYAQVLRTFAPFLTPR